MPSSLVLICPAWAASAATSANGAPAAARVTAATRPSTIGAIGEHDGAVAGVAAQLEGQFCAEHGAAEVHDDEYPSGEATRSMASFTRAASVPSTWPSRPAAISIGGGVPRTICRASSTAASASRRLWETTTMPTMATSCLERRGGGFEEQRRGRGAGILVAGASLAEVAGPTLAGHHRDGVVAAADRGLPRRGERLAG